MDPFRDHPVQHRYAGTLLALAAVVFVIVAASAAIQTKVDNPHGRFKESCDLCHTAKAWNEVKVSRAFDHSKFGFPLSGAHATADCMGCHQSLDFAQSKTLCASCHEDAHRGEMGTDCARCHGARSFHDRGPMVRAHQMSHFPLTGGHATIDCESCHAPAAQGKMQFVGTNADCYSCHQAQYETAPNHVSGGVSKQCQTCHTPFNWTNVNGFSHTAAGFPLTGAHSTSVRQCDDCHHGSYKNTRPDCASCHTSSTPGYNNPGPGAPVHNATYFPASRCATCHGSAAATHTSWQGGTYAHSQIQLTNAHAGRQCEDCHKGNYSTLAFSCYGCHQNSTPGYANATDPPHTPTNFPTSNPSCTSCHNTIAFSPSTFPANHSTTAFAANYTGAHPAQPCTACHNAGTWNVMGTGNNCYGCHSVDYAAATPPHDPTNYPQNGCACHSTTTWLNATAFDHNSVGFPLTGNHSIAARQCNDCHAVIGYTANATDLDCITCHATAYNTPVVKHSSPNFPTTTAQCITCHAAANTNHVTWQGGLFANHAGVTTSFGLSGNHGGMQCSDCHTAVSTDLTQYTCAASCHTSSGFLGHGNKSCAGTTFDAAKATGTMKACYSCHPSGTRSSGC